MLGHVPVNKGAFHVISELTTQDSPLEGQKSISAVPQVTESDDEKSQDEEQALDTCANSRTSR